MSELIPPVAVTLHAFLTFLGLVGNLFILLVHFIDWLKTRELNPCDLIINSISLSNIFLQGAVLFNETCFFLFTLFYAQDWVVKSMVVIMSSLAFCSLWCSTVLCFYYCVKIINVNESFIHKLKAKLPVLVPWMITFSVGVSWGAGLPSYWDLYRESPFSTANYTANITSLISFKFKSKCVCLFQMYMVISGVAFFIISFTAGAIIYSLCKHMIKMRRNNNKGSGSGKIKSHLSAAKTVTSLLLLYLLFYGALNIIFNDTTEVGSLIFSLCFLTVACFPTLNSIVLITGNRKLSNTCKQILGIKSSAGNTEVTLTTC